MFKHMLQCLKTKNKKATEHQGDDDGHMGEQLIQTHAIEICKLKSCIIGQHKRGNDIYLEFSEMCLLKYPRSHAGMIHKIVGVPLLFQKRHKGEKNKSPIPRPFVIELTDNSALSTLL